MSPIQLTYFTGTAFKAPDGATIIQNPHSHIALVDNGNNFHPGTNYVITVSIYQPTPEIIIPETPADELVGE